MALAVPMLLALITGWTAAWWVVVVLLPLPSAYLAVLFRNRRLVAEREINVAFHGSSGMAEATLAELFSDPYEENPARLRAAGGHDW